jgi:hypothetical protein
MTESERHSALSAHAHTEKDESHAMSGVHADPLLDFADHEELQVDGVGGTTFRPHRRWNTPGIARDRRGRGACLSRSMFPSRRDRKATFAPISKGDVHAALNSRGP